MRISGKTDTKFRKFISLTYRSTQKGLLSYVTDLALNQYIDVQSEQQGSTHTQMTSNYEIQRSKTIELKEQIIQYLTDRYYPNPRETRRIPVKQLEEAIRRLKGVVDPRSIKNWKKMLLAYDCIQKVEIDESDYLYEFYRFK